MYFAQNFNPELQSFLVAGQSFIKFALFKIDIAHAIVGWGLLNVIVPKEIGLNFQGLLKEIKGIKQIALPILNYSYLKQWSSSFWMLVTQNFNFNIISLLEILQSFIIFALFIVYTSNIVQTLCSFRVIIPKQILSDLKWMLIMLQWFVIFCLILEDQGHIIEGLGCIISICNFFIFLKYLQGLICVLQTTAILPLLSIDSTKGRVAGCCDDVFLS